MNCPIALIRNAVVGPIICSLLVGCSLLSSPSKLLPVWIAKKGAMEIVLIGEIHGHPFETSRVSRQVDESIRNADAIGEELVSSDNMRVSPNDANHIKISSRVPPEDWAKISKALEKIRLPNGQKFDIEGFDSLNPIWAAGIIEMYGWLRAGKAISVEVSTIHKSWYEIIHSRRRPGIPRLSLDTVDEKNNIWLYCEKKPAKAADLIRSAMDSWEDDDYRIALRKTLPEATRNGNVSGIEEIIGEKSEFEYVRIVNECLVWPRNRLWLNRMIDNADKYRRVVYLVGIGHLIGQNGLVTLLRTKGFEIQQLQGD